MDLMCEKQNLKVPAGHSLFKRVFLLCSAIVATIVVSGCARYAPVPPPAPTNRILTITLTTREAITDEFYYYVAFDLDNSADGPYHYLSGINIARNWDYYIRLYQGEFTEQHINVEDDIYEVPEIFNTTSDLYYSTSLSSNQITIRLYLNKLKDGDYSFKLNFITARQPLTDTEVAIQTVDYLDIPTLPLSSIDGTYAYSSQYPNINMTASSEDDYPADIYIWIARVDEL